MKKRFLKAIGRTVVAAALIVPSFAAVAGFGALGHTQGIPTVATDVDASAAGNGLTIAFNAPTIATAGSIAPNGTVDITVRTKMGGVADPGVTVYLCECQETPNVPDGVPGDSTTVPAAQCGGVGTQPRNRGAAAVRHRLEWLLGHDLSRAGDSSGARTCRLGRSTDERPSKTKAQTHYVYTTVYRFGPSPIANPGTLAAGATVPITLSADDSLDQGIAGSTAYLSFKGAGAASVGGTNLTGTPVLFNADANGLVQISYTAPSPLPSSGQDTITVQDEFEQASGDQHRHLRFRVEHPGHLDW